ncbi:uncharacterized protein PHACADRAFT_214845 [Phanerochaete carnosa HHB-10118-sp]|uniref:Uncharacterized protein n=1 Tax=Phanerochaete carnosa (strain HHB-10118-sp) TaxID=650164 RepID=K5WDX1_PHACS|nr:uncharacterized protein PHACADRAFT_214845 [Phanerochaete carnosa HHB-10118-sp]EKM48337.1 hypothetical protein PHACADRAFT_214845 [Phanerochaete carnosa HHB-10118-sp]
MTSTPTPGAALDAPDFFSVEGLAVNAGVGQVERHTLSPVEAHNHIRPFLRDNYHFENAGRVQGFVRILASVNDRNKAWTSDDAQSFLEHIVNGNGVIRIGDVLHFRPVSHYIGQRTGNLSFQRGYFPIFEFMSSDLILKTTLHKNTNHLYTILEHNYEEIQEVMRSCIGGMVGAKTWRDTTPNLPPMLQSDLDGVLVFKSLTTVYLQYLNRFKDAIKQHPDLAGFIQDFASWFNTWAADVCSDPPTFHDTVTNADPATRRLVLNQLREELDRLVSIVDRESGIKKKAHQAPHTGMTPEQRRQAKIMQLKYTYDPPGELRPEGPRHDNDFADISQIRVAPTHDELLCPSAQYLPVFSPDAPHHLSPDSMERHLDIQFRLLREELIAPIRGSIVTIDNDVTTMLQSQGRARRKTEQTKLEQLLAKGGGAYKTSGFDSVFFRVYANAEFCPRRRSR